MKPVANILWKMEMLNSMKRRKFLYDSGLITGYIAATNPLIGAPQEQSVPFQVSRSSRLFPDSTSKSSASSFLPPVQLQDLAVAGDHIIALYRNTATGSFSLAAVDRSGSPLWNYPLARGLYVGLGTRSQGTAPLLHALQFQKTQNCVIEFDPANGRMDIAGLASGGGFAFRSAGDSLLARATGSGGIEIWNVAGVPAMAITASFESAFSDRLPMIEPAGNGTVAIFSHNLFQVAAVDLRTGSVKTTQLSSPEISASTDYYKKYDGSSTIPTLITASGVDRSGNVAILISPYFKGLGNILTVNPATGAISGRMQVQLPPRNSGGFGVPFRIVGNSNETGIVHADGSIAWFAA